MLLTAIGDSWPQEQVDAAIELLTSSEGRFPSGIRKLPSDLVGAVQRERLIVAMLMAASELGYREVNVQSVIDRAGVSRPTFYEHFANKEDCFLAAFDTTAARLQDRVGEAAREGGDCWRSRLRLGLKALLDFAVKDPDAARTLIVEARAGSTAAVQRRDDMLDYFTNRIDGKGRELLPDSPTHSAITAAGIIGGVESILYARLNKGEVEDLNALLPSLMYFVVLPYEGHEAASEELALAVS
jgi:AcrR family transcriptional regulator